LFKGDSVNEKNGEKEKPFEQIGVVSAGPLGCTKNKLEIRKLKAESPMIFSRVAYHLDWIRKTINNTGKFCPRP